VQHSKTSKENAMKEIRLSIIQNDLDPAKDKRVDIHITDADAVLSGIQATAGHPLQMGAGELGDLVKTVLAKCGDTDKVEIGVDADGKLNPKSAFIAKGDGSGATVPFAI
jgi:hypothetical protein